MLVRVSVRSGADSGGLLFQVTLIIQFQRKVVVNPHLQTGFGVDSGIFAEAAQYLHALNKFSVVSQLPLIA